MAIPDQAHTDAELAEFATRLTEFRMSLPEPQRALLDELVVAARAAREAGSEVSGYSLGLNMWSLAAFKYQIEPPMISGPGGGVSEPDPAHESNSIPGGLGDAAGRL